MCLTLERLVAPAMLRTVASLLVAGWWSCIAVLSTTTLVYVQIVTKEEEKQTQ